MPAAAAMLREMAHTGGGDAITAAAEWCAAARELPGDAAVMAFGSRESALVLVGEARRLCLQRYGETPLNREALWTRFEEFCRSRAFMAGYIGFDAVWPDGIPRPTCSSPPTLHFWEPQGVVRIAAADGAPPRATVLQSCESLRALQPARLGSSEPVTLGDFDTELRPFQESVAQTIASIQRGEGRRLTLARRVDLPQDLDLVASFAAPPAADDPEVGRSFYARTSALELAGHSPELLGRGDERNFTCYKLSGTGPRDPDRAEDERLRAEFLSDPKILDEHALSIAGTRIALGRVGTVQAGPMRVCSRPGLRHLLTPLTVGVRPGVPWSGILRAILPAGAQPPAAGLRSLDGLERSGRRAYYGVLGLRLPDGRFEFSQVLRTLFRDASGVHTFVGAAVTGGSTVEDETAETRLKLDDIVARRRSNGDSPDFAARR